MLKEFKDFIMTGNVIEFAVAVILAVAVGAVVNGFVSDIIMPIVGFFSGGVNFDNLFYILGDGEYTSLAVAEEAGAAVIAYGRWINTIVSLVIIGLVLFIIVKAYNKMKAPKEAPAPEGPTSEQLLAEIRDELKKQK